MLGSASNFRALCKSVFHIEEETALTAGAARKTKTKDDAPQHLYADIHHFHIKIKIPTDNTLIKLQVDNKKKIR